MKPAGLYSTYDGVALLAARRTPWADLGGALSRASPIDLGISVSRAALRDWGHEVGAIDTVIAGSMAQASFDAYLLPRHIGLYCGVPQSVPALAVQRICGTGFEVLRQAAEHIRGGGDHALCVGTESMSRNPIAAYTHRSGFRLGAPVEFKDFLWEALFDPAPGIDMIATAENLAVRYGTDREQADAFALMSHNRAMASQREGRWMDEIAPVVRETFECGTYQPRAIELPRGIESVSVDSHPRATDAEALARLNPVHRGGIQTAGNSCAVVDGAAAAVVGRERAGVPSLARLCASAVVGVAPEIMGIGPAPAIELLLGRSGLVLDDIAIFEINEAQSAQVLAVSRALEIDPECINRWGGSIALGHPLAATGLRLAMTAARQLHACRGRYAVVAACIGGGQGMALLLENPEFGN
ncbi:thiolase family protein [Pseudomonas sp. Marseille-QA0892]